MKLVIPPVEQLGPRMTTHLLEEIAEEDDEEQTVEVEGQSVAFIPAKLSLSFDAPLDTCTEMRNLYTITNSILITLLEKSKPGKPHPQMLGYIKQACDVLSKYHGMTENIQQEASLQKMKTVQAMFEMNPALSDEFKIKYLKEMRNKIALLEAAKK